MKILLLGEYSNVHATLADGLRALGHEVLVASDGDGWKNYPRDVDLARPCGNRWDDLKYLWRLQREFRKFRGFDVVQLINPVFLPLKAERLWPFYAYLRRNNRAVFMGAFGMDHYWVKAGLDCRTFRYSDFNIGAQVRENRDNTVWIGDWLEGAKGRLNRRVAEDCDGIVAGLYEYYRSYQPYFSDKLDFIPFPIRCDRYDAERGREEGVVRFFIGIQCQRNAYKGTDIMLRALERVERRYPSRCRIRKAESVPFAEYVQLMRDSDVILDQLYSYTPAMNALEAMAHGLVVVGGGEPENYEILGEKGLRPIVNVLPDEEDVYQALCRIVESPGRLPELSRQSRQYVERHHDHVLVARRYVDCWLRRSPALFSSHRGETFVPPG